MRIELAILKRLETAHPRLLKKSVLKAETGFELDRLTTTDFESALAALDEKQQVRIHTGEDVVRVAITDQGRERVAAAQ